MVARSILSLLGPLVFLGACDRDAGDDRINATSDGAQTQKSTGNAFVIDPATGSVSARHTDPDGATIQLEAGADLPVALPEPFTAMPDAEILQNTRVEKGTARLVYLDFTTDRPVDDVIAFYRGQAGGGGIVTLVDIAGDDNHTLAGENGGLALEFSISARRSAGRTHGQLVVSKGI